ncbi:MAG: hypothetical protein M1312_02345 [Patescibacteria group bacterium]|nr:hypothetical protein [Patescibacteria group bacterium]MDE2144917.1 hypothetical protein [Patescibacteria group bacterium]
MDYLKLLKERAKKSRVYSPHQSIGLTVAKILGDDQHKSLYIKLAKEYKNADLIELARSVAEKKNVNNKGAYFMKLTEKFKKDKHNENTDHKKQDGGEVSA